MKIKKKARKQMEKLFSDICNHIFEKNKEELLEIQKHIYGTGECPQVSVAWDHSKNDIKIVILKEKV